MVDPLQSGFVGEILQKPSSLPLKINARFLNARLTGVQRYSWELLKAWDDLIAQGSLDSAPRITCLTPRSAAAPQPWAHLPVHAVGRLGGNLWEQIDLPLAAGADLLFSPGNIGPYFYANQIVTLHDTSVFSFPQAYSLTFRLKYRLIMRRLGRHARRILTVSHFSKAELIRWCGISADKIDVIYEGKEHILRTQADAHALERSGLSARPYFLAVGSNSAHKNFQIVLDAFEQMQRPDMDLAIIGGDFSKVFRSQSYRLPANARRVGYVSDAELKALYQGAVGLVFPSLYEGFGIPPLEAMACACPVICSQAASLKEVGGDAVVYFNPQDARMLAEQMGHLADDAALRDDLRHKGLAQAAKFSWRQAALETWEIIRALL